MKLIAHRGASGYFPENTRAAFQAALDMGAVSVELDVQQTKDGELAVIHDTDLKRLAGARALVGELRYEELARHDVGAWFGPRFKGARAPRLKEALELLLRHRVEAHVEVKQAQTPYEGIEKRVLEAISQMPSGKALCVVSSADHPTLHRLRKLDKGLRLGCLASHTPLEQALGEACELACESVHISGRVFSERWADQAHLKGLKIFVYTINERRDAERLKSLGVDGIFSDYPDLLRPADPVGGTL
ncbi:MAG: glycerophosphodiester phosphodiesterase [Elusimicrobia bacterium]|nr:glycerophosphodiester phosphodiesterase [Elusimicrobiota bacterium]